eukprot:TRINITY_DN10059_c0_g1_i1.p1 TRINITY_DN10059_c0_g1~~TRINITY_DN10059_c0_g1_i1.p1  ORF type:complete len:321 (-),score=33.07 TRINITY_DN10059_c0_g1_i1:66-1028(-)
MVNLENIYPEFKNLEYNSRRTILLHRIIYRTYGGEKGRVRNVRKWNGIDGKSVTVVEKNYNFAANMEPIDTSSLIFVVETVLRLTVDDSIIKSKDRNAIIDVIRIFLENPNTESVSSKESTTMIAMNQIQSLVDRKLESSSTRSVFHSFVSDDRWPEVLYMLERFKDRSMLLENDVMIVINGKEQKQKNCGLYRCLQKNAPLQVIEAASKMLETFRMDHVKKFKILSAMNGGTTSAMAKALKLFIRPSDIAQMVIKPDRGILDKSVPESTIVELFKDLSPDDMMNGPVYYAFQGSDYMAKELLKTVDFECVDKVFVFYEI